MPPPKDNGLTGPEQQDDVGGQLLVIELVAVFLGLDQVAGEVVTGIAAAQIRQSLKYV